MFVPNNYIDQCWGSVVTGKIQVRSRMRAQDIINRGIVGFFWKILKERTNWDEGMTATNPSQKTELGLPFVNCQKIAQFESRHLFVKFYK